MDLLQDTAVHQELKKAGFPKNWTDYLMDRVKILVQYENYSPQSARAEVTKMIPYYNGAALAKSKG